MTLRFAIDTFEDVKSGERDRIVPAVLTLALRFALASFVIATLVPYFAPDAARELTIAGAAIFAALSSFLKFS